MTFRKAIMFFIALLLFSSAYAQVGNFTLTVIKKDPKTSEKLFLMFRNTPSTMRFDSASLENGKYVIKGEVPFNQRVALYLYPGNAAFTKTPRDKPGIPVYLESGNIVMEIGDNENDIKLTGTPTNNDLGEYLQMIAPFEGQISKMETQFASAQAKNDSAAMVLLQSSYADVSKKEKEVQVQFFNTHLDSQVSLDWLIRNMDIENEKTVTQQMLNKMSQRLRDTEQAKRYAAKLAEVKSIEVGVEAPELTAKDPEGKDVSLSSFRGKYVLLDFWASWCGPCRLENPNVLKAYSKYKGKNFEILSFSLDDKKEAWLQAVKKDGLTWTQVCDFMAWQSPILYTYAIRSVPSNFLIDPNGKIIAKNLRGEELQQKLNEIFNK